MGSLFSGSQTTETTVPEFVTEGGKYGVDRSKQLAERGYMPYFGPDVAALSPLEYAGMQNTQSAANAFNMATPQAAPGAENGAAMTTGNYQTAAVGDSERAQLIADLYQRHLGRTPDQAGYEYWMQDGTSPQDLERAFIAGIQNDALTGLPAASNVGGMSGYSSGPMYQSALDQVQQRMPGLFDHYSEMFVDPGRRERPDLGGLLGGNFGGRR